MPTNKQRRDASRRHLERQLQRRQEQERGRRRSTLIASVVGTVVLVAVVVVFVVAVGNDDKKNSAGGGATPSQSSGSCQFAKTDDAARKVTPPPTHVPTSGIVTVQVQTNRGDMTFRLNRDKAPCTVASFESLVKQKFYDDTPCHRLTTSNIYVLQCGDPGGSGGGGPGYSIPDEYVGTEQYTTGVLAMANKGGKNTGGSQFFIVYRTTSLPATYTIFGTVTKGISVVEKVAAKGTDNANQQGDGHPILKIQFTKLTVAS
jgi:peptidyl-prolyl cis-trans isomerase B (cyclophilin B)